MHGRYKTVVTHGESGSLFQVVDTWQPECEQPCVVLSWNTSNEPNAAYLARDFCDRHNSK